MENERKSVLVGRTHKYMDFGRATTEVSQEYSKALGNFVILKQTLYQKNDEEYTKMRPAEVIILDIDQIDGIIDMLMSSTEVR